MKIQSRLLVLAAVLLAVPACSPARPAAPTVAMTSAPAALPSSTPTEVQMAFQLTSTAFSQGDSIPPVYTCTGRNVSPALAWRDPPAGSQSFALIMDDPDAPSGTFTHWVLYNLPASSSGLAENVPADPQLADGSLQGKNSAGRSGYIGPCPPSGTHRYFFKLYALDGALSLSAGANAAGLLQAMQGHILGSAELMGTYKK